MTTNSHDDVQDLIKHIRDNLAQFESDSYKFPNTERVYRIALAALLLRPVELPDCVDDLHGVGPVMSADAVVQALRQQGCEVKHD